MKKYEIINQEYLRIQEENESGDIETIQLLVEVYGAESVSQWLIAKTNGLLDENKAETN